MQSSVPFIECIHTVIWPTTTADVTNRVIRKYEKMRTLKKIASSARKNKNTHFTVRDGEVI